MNASLAITVANSVAVLRAQPAGSAGDVVACQALGAGQWSLYTWAPMSADADDGIAVIKPDAVGAASAGRWLLRAHLELGGERSAEVVQALPWDGSRAAVLLEDGWRIVGASSTHVFVARPVEVTSP